MKFEPGNKLAKGGKRDGAGRPPKQRTEVKRLAQDIAREYIAAHVEPILETYVGLAAGKVVERINENGKVELELKVDPATTRHAVDKLLPEIKTDDSTRPIAIQIIHEANSTAKSEGDSLTIHIGSD